MLRSLLALSAISLLPLAAHADSLACNGAGEVAVQIEHSRNAASSYMQIAGRDIPALRECMGWAHGNPRIGASWRCPHGEVGSKVRYEVYPMLAPANGDAPYVHIVKWNGDTAENIDLKDCE